MGRSNKAVPQRKPTASKDGKVEPKKRGRKAGLNIRRTYRQKRIDKRLEALKWIELQRRFAATLRAAEEKSEIPWSPRPTTNVQKFEFLYLFCLPDPKVRRATLRRIFGATFNRNDGVYIRILYDYCTNANHHSKKLTFKYFKEQKQ